MFTKTTALALILALVMAAFCAIIVVSADAGEASVDLEESSELPKSCDPGANVSGEPPEEESSGEPAVSSEEESAVAPVSSEEPTIPTPPSPPTGDAGLVTFALLALISGAAALVLKKRA